MKLHCICHLPCCYCWYWYHTAYGWWRAGQRLDEWCTLFIASNSHTSRTIKRSSRCLCQFEFCMRPTNLNVSFMLVLLLAFWNVSVGKGGVEMGGGSVWGYRKLTRTALHCNFVCDLLVLECVGSGRGTCRAETDIPCALCLVRHRRQARLLFVISSTFFWLLAAPPSDVLAHLLRRKF